ncbi:hypothetical protein ACJRO7_021192 [Eucalyptus globulus]|uniref:Uncharacterized protein n=1 Tax=Eucalyptus globulus TaxID=34317 RepID=A0ABD3KJ00_EUCGL
MAFNKVVVLSLALALIFFSSLPGLTEGRKWRLEKYNSPSMSGTGPDDIREDGHAIHPMSYDQAASFRPTSPGHSPGVGHELPPQVAAFRPTSPGHSPGVGHELPPQVAAFRPTSPGHSPGVGHELPPQLAAFRPTSPGHSPGVGHELRPLAP